jgi:putative transposase
MPRIPRVVIPDYPHHVTQRGSNRMEIFIDNQDREVFLSELRRWSGLTGTDVLAYCLMGNHFHLILIPHSEDGLARCLHGLTFQYAQHFNVKYARSGRLWQNRYFSCPIEPLGSSWAVMRYVERNPVRAGLVPKAEDWLWSSARAHIMGTHDPRLSPTCVLTDEQRNEYREFMTEDSAENAIRKATTTGRPLGTPDFVMKLEQELKRKLSASRVGRPKKEDEE